MTLFKWYLAVQPTTNRPIFIYVKYEIYVSIVHLNRNSIKALSMMCYMQYRDVMNRVMTMPCCNLPRVSSLAVVSLSDVAWRAEMCDWERRRHDIEMPSALLVLGEVTPPVTDWFPLQTASNVEHGFVLFSWSCWTNRFLWLSCNVALMGRLGLSTPIHMNQICNLWVNSQTD